MAKTVENFIEPVSYELDDAAQTRFTTRHYVIAFDESARAVRRTAQKVNPDFLQYELGEKTEYWEAGFEIMTTGHASAPAESGTAEDIAGGSNNALLDDDKQWVIDMWDGYTLVITTNTGTGQRFTIASNTPSTLTISGTWTTEPDSTSQYEIYSPDDTIFDNERMLSTKPLPTAKYNNAYVRIQSGTAVGTEKEIDTLGNYYIEAEDDFATAPADGDEYEIVAVIRDYSLPSDFGEIVHVKVDGEEAYEWQPNIARPSNRQPSYSIEGTNLRMTDLSGGEQIELIYSPAWGSMTTTAEVPYGELFYDSHKYYAVMKMKGWNYEQIVNEAAFYRPIHAAMQKTMTDANQRDYDGVQSEYEEFEG